MSISAIWASAGASWVQSGRQGQGEAPSDAVRAGERPSAPNALSSLTANDRSLIAAATGMVIAPDGSIEGGASYSPGATGSVLNDFVFVIAAARAIDTVQGAITPQALQGLFPPYITAKNPDVARAVANGVAYLQQRSTTTSSSGLDVSV